MILDSLVSAVRGTGGIGVAGVYVPHDPQASAEGAKDGRIGAEAPEACDQFGNRAGGYTKVLLHP